MPCEDAGKGLTFDELHREKPLVAVLADVVGPRDVTMRDPARELHLLAKAAQDFLRVDQLSAEHFERDELLEVLRAETHEVENLSGRHVRTLIVELKTAGKA